MLSAGQSLRHGNVFIFVRLCSILTCQSPVNHAARTLQATQLASASRNASWFPNFKWPDMMKGIRTREREKKDDKKFDAAKREVEEPTASESRFVAPPESETDIGPSTAPNGSARKYTEVNSIDFTTATLVMPDVSNSTSIRLPTSKYRIEN